MIFNFWVAYSDFNCCDPAFFHPEDDQVQGEAERDDWCKNLGNEWAYWRNRASQDVQLGNTALQPCVGETKDRIRSIDKEL